MLQKLKKMIIYVLIFLVVVALGIYVFMQQAQFGQEPQGKRLERIQQSPYYKDGAFQNLSPTPALAEEPLLGYHQSSTPNYPQ
jgi:flagellar basal body-associated protein FliL